MRFSALLPALLAIALLSVPPAAAQDDDRGFLTRLLEDNLSSAGRVVTITGFEGALSSRAALEELTIADDEGVWLILRGATLDWNRGALVRRRVEVNELTAREIVVVRPPVASKGIAPLPAAAPGFSLPELPVSIRIDALRAERVELGEGVLGEAVVVALDAAASLADGEGAARLTLERIDGAEARIEIDGAYDNSARALRLFLSAHEGAGGIAARMIGLPGAPRLHLTIDGEGPIADFTADIGLATDGEDRLSGQVTLREDEEDDAGGPPTRVFRAELGGDIAPLFLPEYRAFFGPDVRLGVDGARQSSGRIDLTRIDIAAEALTLEGRASIAPDGLPDVLDISGTIGSADGTPVLLPLGGAPTRIDRAEFRLALDDDGEGRAGRQGWRLRAGVRGLDRPDITIVDVAITGSGRLVHTPQTVGGTLDFDAGGLAPADPDVARALGRTLTGRAIFTWQEDTPVRVPRLRLDGADYGLTVSGLRIEGIDSALRIAGRAEGELADLHRFSGLAGRDLGGAGRLLLDGSYEVLSGVVDVDLDLAGRDLAFDVSELDNLLRGESRIALAARRDETGTTLRAFDVDAGTLSIRASGRIVEGDSDLTADLAFSDLAVLGEPWGGTLRASARIVEEDNTQVITVTATGQALVTGQIELDRLLAGDSTIGLEAARRGDAIDISRLVVDAATLSARASGRYLPGESDLTATLDFGDLAVLGGPYGGALRAEARVVEDGDAQHLTLNATGRGLSAGQAAPDRLLAGISTIDLDARRQGEVITVARAALEAATLRVTGHGRIVPGASDLRADLAFSDLSALGGPWRGALNAAARVTEDGTERRLVMTADARDLGVGQAEADLLLRGATDLALDMREDRGRIRIDRFDLANPQLTVRADATLDGAERRVGLDARLADLGLLVPGFPGPLTVEGTVRELATAYAVDLRARGPGAIDATLAGTVAEDFGRVDLALRGGLETGLINRLISPRSIEGTASFDLRIDGPPGIGALSGRVTVPSARVVDPGTGIGLRNLSVSADLGGGRATLAATGIINEGGRVTLNGPVTLSAPYPADLRLNLDSVILSDPELYRARIWGDLDITGPLTGGGRIAGNLELGDTELRIPSTGFGGNGILIDMTHVGEPAAVRATRARAGLLERGNGGRDRPTAAPFGLDIGITAPGRIFIRGRGLDAELGGNLRVTGTTDNIVPVGGFELVRGRLDILGQRFTLDEGRAQMQGNLIPYIRLAASTETGDITATVLVEGPATEPGISFLSSPQLPEEEVLARLLFGRDIGSISAFQALQLASAVATLAGRGGDGVVSRLREGFGLDDLDIITDDDGTAGVRAGKYISRNVYTDVTVDSQGKTEINLNIDVTSSIKARGRARSDGSTGVGIYIERDF